MKDKLKFKGIEYDSWDEVYFAMWCWELQQQGYIEAWSREGYSFVITEGLDNRWTEVVRLKTKTKIEEKKQCILRGHEYTPDFIILWNDIAYLKLYNILQCGQKIELPFIAQQEDAEPYSIVEVKPSFDRNNMTRLFTTTQKIIWDKYEKFVNLIKINELFPLTFTPKGYLKTPTGKAKKINWKVRSVAQFLRSLD